MQQSSSKTKNFQDVKNHYILLRKIAYEQTEQEFSGNAISLREISFSDVVKADQWTNSWSEQQKRPIWSWRNMYHLYQGRNELKRFDLAVCSNGELAALCYGRPSKNKILLKIHCVARKPFNNPLTGKILDIVLFAAISYATLLGSQEIWLIEPMNLGLVKIYEKYGYTAQRNKSGVITHLAMRLT